MRGAIAVLVLIIPVGFLAACGTPSGPRTIRVPQDAATGKEAIEKAQAGDTIELAEGVYKDSLTVNVPDVTIRGANRNKTILDGEGNRQNGIVVIAEGVRVENLTVHSYVQNGVLVTGMNDGTSGQALGVRSYERLDPAQYPPLKRYAVDSVTAYNNGLYGIYAFNTQTGSITNNYTSGSADSGLYLGQCKNCQSTISGNVSENNAIGFENANASDSVYLIGNRFTNNRVGVTLISNYQEAFAPQANNTVVGNVISNNSEPESPAQADGAFGVGVGISGGTSNLLKNNRIEGSPAAGVVFNNTENLAAKENKIQGNATARNGTDYANIAAPRAPSAGNCITPSGTANFLPESLKSSSCDVTDVQQKPNESAGSDALPKIDVPKGKSFLKISPPPDQPNKPQQSQGKIPEAFTAPEAGAIEIPVPTLLQERTRRP